MEFSTRSPRLVDRPLALLPDHSGLKTGDGSTMIADSTLTEWLWTESQKLANEALCTPFIQGMKTGKLNPTYFGIYNIQDAVYCYNATTAISNVVARSTGDIKKYAQVKLKSYKEYTDELFKMWYIDNPCAVAMGTAAAGYSDYELWVSKDLDPIYSFIATLPCSRLWPWLGEQLVPNKSTYGVYKSWIEENLTGSGYKKLEAFINVHSKIINRDEALKVYQRCMQGEADFFASAVKTI